jgi:uncharacterized ferritin-like protein (DUF455 family)
MKRFSDAAMDWQPFVICGPGEKTPYARSLSTPEGLGDRLRFVAFAEKQAVHAFLIASETYDVPEAVRQIWRTLSREENKHLNWLLERMKELGIDPAGRPQSMSLWQSFDRCETPAEFANFMANAEDHGRIAGEKFYQTLIGIDPITATLFKRIAEDEVEHIELAKAVFQLGSF